MFLELIKGNTLEKMKELNDNSIDLIITSPPYWKLRDYGFENQLGLEDTLEDYLDNLMKWVKESYRILKPTGSFVLNISDCFYRKEKQPKKESILKNLYRSKQLIAVSHFAYCRIITETNFICRGIHLWLKPIALMPLNFKRLNQNHEYLYWFTKKPNYYFNEKPWLKENQERKPRLTDLPLVFKGDEIPKEKIEDKKFIIPNKYRIENSWRIVAVGTKQSGFELSENQKSIHLAPFPEKLIEPYIQSLCPENGIVLDPFMGSGTTMRVAMENNRNCIGIEFKQEYIDYIKKRVNWGKGFNIQYIEK